MFGARSYIVFMLLYSVWFEFCVVYVCVIVCFIECVCVCVDGVFVFVLYVIVIGVFDVCEGDVCDVFECFVDDVVMLCDVFVFDDVGDEVMILGVM